MQNIFVHNLLNTTVSRYHASIHCIAKQRTQNSSTSRAESSSSPLFYDLKDLLKVLIYRTTSTKSRQKNIVLRFPKYRPEQFEKMYTTSPTPFNSTSRSKFCNNEEGISAKHNSLATTSGQALHIGL